MKKLAVFVEGQTELYFVERLLQEIAGFQNIEIQLERKIGYRIVALKSRSSTHGDEGYAALICDCQGEGSVKSAMQERVSDLVKNGYGTILGLRDLYPLKLADRKKLIQGVNEGLDCPGAIVKIVVAVMEVEAWFLKEERHFIRLDPSLAPAFIAQKFGFDPTSDDVTKIRHPSDLLGKIYKSVGRSYKKKYKHAQRTVALLDYDNLYTEVTGRVESLAVFLEYVDHFLVAE